MAISKDANDILYCTSPEKVLSAYSNCIVVGNNNLDMVTSELQKSFANAQNAAIEYMSRLEEARDKVSREKEEIRRQREEESRKNRGWNI